MTFNPLEQRVQETIEPSLAALGYDLVQVRLHDAAKRRTLTIMAERKDGNAMSFDDCAEISTTASALLDVEDFITGAYDLEVSSPGIDRPLTKLQDFLRYKGHEVKLETIMPMEGRKRFRGIIGEARGEEIIITVDGKDYAISSGNIRTAKLVLTDALIAAAMKKENV